MPTCWTCDEGGVSPAPSAALEACTTADEVAALLDSRAFRLAAESGAATLIARALHWLALHGTPIEAARLASLASDLPDASQAIDTARRMAETDDSGRVVGLVGLSLRDHPHRFVVDGRTFHTWCAWDTLFLAPLLDRPADVHSRDPETGAPIRLRVTPGGVEEAGEVVVSIVAPGAPEDAPWDAARAQAVFCQYVHFFASRDSGARWCAARDMPAALLSLPEAFRLAALRFGALIERGQAEAAGSRTSHE